MTTTPKRKVGRPRKVVEEVNPDCEPATKGYVKCLLRKTRDHTHCGVPVFTIVFSAVLSLLGVFVTNYTIVLIGLFGFIIAFDIDNIGGIAEDGVPTQLYPHCKQKNKDCE